MNNDQKVNKIAGKLLGKKGGEGYKEGGRRRTEKDALEREREGLVLHSYPGQISW